MNRQQQQDEVLVNDIQQEEEEEHEEEQKKSSVLLQPPFRVGAVVNLFAALLRLTQQQKKHINEEMFPIGAEMQETTAGADAAALFGASAARVPPTTVSPAAAPWEEERTCVFSAEQQEAAVFVESSSWLTERIPTAGEVPVKVKKGKASGTAAADVAARTLKAPTGELGRQLLLILLRLVKKRRQLVRLCSAESSDEAETAPSSECLAFREGASASYSTSVKVLLNCWFSSLDAAVLLNDEDMEEGHSDGVSPIQRGGLDESKSSSCMGDAPEATPPPLTGGTSNGGISRAAVGGATAFVSPGACVEAAAASRRTAVEAYRVCGSCERSHERVEETAAAEEEALLPSSTFLQLLPDLLHGLVEAGAALPYCASAAPFPPVLLELRWQQPSSSVEATSKVEEAMSPLETWSPLSAPAMAPHEAAGMFPRAADEKASFGSLPVASAAATGISLAKTRDATATREEAQATAAHASQRRVSCACTGVSSSEGFRPAPAVDGWSLSTEVLFSTTRPPAAAQERRSPRAVSPGGAEGSASLGNTTAAPPVAALENSTVPGCSPPTALPSSKRLLLAPAGLLQQLRTHSSAAAGSTLEQQADSPDVNSGKREGSISSARRAVAAERDSGSHTSYVEGAVCTEERTAREGCAVRLAVQEQLFNFVYYRLQDAVRGGPLAEDFWRRGNCMPREGSDWRNAASVCCSSRDDNDRHRVSSDRFNVGEDVETQWLDCVEQCVLETMYTQIQLLCVSLRRYSTCITQQDWSDSFIRTEATAQPAGFIANSPAKLQQEETPAGAACVTVLEPAGQVLQQEDLQIKQQQKKQDGEVQRHQHCDRQLAKQEEDLRELRGHKQDIDKLSLEGDRCCYANTGSPAAADVAAAAHMLLQLAGDLALLAYINELALRDNCSSTGWGCCSAETGKIFSEASTEARGTLAAGPWETHASNVESGSVASRTAATTATATAEASASTVAVPRRRRAAMEVRSAAKVESSHTATAEGSRSVTAGASLSVTGPDTTVNCGLVSSGCRHSSYTTRSKEESKRNTGRTCGLLRWWVKDEKCSPRSTPCKRVVIEVTVGTCAGSSYSRGRSALATRVFPLCHLSALSGVCTPQEQIEGVAALEPVSRYADNLQQEQSCERKQNAQQRQTSGRTCQPQDSRETAGGKHVTKAEEKQAVVAFKMRDQAKGNPSFDDKVYPVRERAAGARRAATVRCWLSLVGQLEQDENISLSVPSQKLLIKK